MEPFTMTIAAFNRFLLVLILILMLQTSAWAQAGPGDVSLDVELTPSLTSAQTLSLAMFGMDSRGTASRIMNIIIENTTGNDISNLYLHISVSVSGTGTISHIDQIQGMPFSLRAGQAVVSDNIDLQRGLSGVPEYVRLSGNLTSAGEEFINSLGGSSTLPDRMYAIEFQIYSGNNRLNGGIRIAEASAVLPVEEMFTDIGFDLDAPGNIIGAPLERLSTTRPVFRWQGNATQKYRVVIVEAAEGQSAQGLIQAALDTEPVMGAAETGSLLEFEMADVVVTGNYFNYPVAMVQPLQTGQRYYWQVFASLNTPSGTVLQPSPVWQFGIQSPGSSLSELDEEILEMLSRFLPDQYLYLILNGFTVGSAEVNGQTVSGTQLLSEIERFVQDIESGIIQIVE
jgi:hypothetical protein